jgi:hypothetical protein
MKMIIIIINDNNENTIMSKMNNNAPIFDDLINENVPLRLLLLLAVAVKIMYVM